MQHFLINFKLWIKKYLLLLQKIKFPKKDNLISLIMGKTAEKSSGYIFRYLSKLVKKNKNESKGRLKNIEHQGSHVIFRDEVHTCHLPSLFL